MQMRRMTRKQQDDIGLFPTSPVFFSVSLGASPHLTVVGVERQHGRFFAVPDAPEEEAVNC